MDAKAYDFGPAGITAGSRSLQDAQLLEKLGLDPGKLAEKAAERGLASL